MVNPLRCRPAPIHIYYQVVATGGADICGYQVASGEAASEFFIDGKHPGMYAGCPWPMPVRLNELVAFFGIEFDPRAPRRYDVPQCLGVRERIRERGDAYVLRRNLTADEIQTLDGLLAAQE